MKLNRVPYINLIGYPLPHIVNLNTFYIFRRKLFSDKTFLEKAQYFYEFTKLFDLSKINSTITHKFMSFFVKKNIAKNIYTQNIDNLEIKAKIPNDKIFFSHGNFYTGNCASCNKE